MNIETRNAGEIIETLKKCQGIKIVMIVFNLENSRETFENMARYLEAIDKIASLKRMSEGLSFKLVNDSSFTMLPAAQESLLGVRASQVIVSDELLNEKFYREVAMPLISSDHKPIFRTGVFKYEKT